MKRTLRTMLCLLVLLGLLAGCAGKPAPATQPPAPTAPKSHTLTIAVSGDVETVDPPFSHYQRANEVNFNVFDPMFNYASKDAGGYKAYDVTKIIGRSVESWKVSDDGLTAVLKIRPGMKFNHTGNPVTADDFIYWFERAVALKAGTNWNVEHGYIKAWKKTGDNEVTITFSQPSPYFFYLFRDQSQGPADMKALKSHATSDDPWATKWAAHNDTGSGAYYLEKATPGVEFVLKANKDYWAGAPFFDQVVLKVVPNSADRVLLLQQGAVDIAEDLSADDFAKLGSTQGVKVLSIPSRDQWLVGLNATKPPFSNKLVRQALSYAVPYDDIVKNVFYGQAIKPGGVVPAKGLMNDPGTFPYNYNLDKAKALLAQAGYDKGFSFNLDIPTGDATAEQLAVVLQSELKKLNVTVTIVKQEAAVFAEGLDKKSHQAWLRDLLWYVDDPQYAAFGKMCGNDLNWTGYCNPAADEAIKAGAALWRPEDQAKKAQLASQMQKIVNDDAPILYLAETNYQIAMRSDIEGYMHLPDNLLWYYPLHRK